MGKISLIIPVYNVEDYVGKCLDSVIKQTYKNLEILVVDDGSTDDSGKICDEYAKKDSRIKVFHKDNGGNTAIPRNVGLSNMTGEYVGFVDSDDWIEPDMYEKLYNAINGVDVAVCSYFKDTISGSQEIENMKKIREHVISTQNMLIYPLMRNYYMGFCGYVWNKLFKAELFDGLRFDESIKYASDVLTYTELIKRGNVKGTYIEKPLYHYIVSRAGAVTKSESYNVKTDILRSYRGIEELLPDKDKYWARGFYCYHASVVAELARKKRDKKMLAKMQKEINASYGDYRRTNRRFPQKWKDIKDLSIAKLVNHREYDINRFAEQIGDKLIICFGAYAQFSDWVMQNPEVSNRIVSIVDNSTSIQGGVCKIGDNKVPVVSLEKILKMKIDNFVILINAIRHVDDIIKQLDLSGELEDVDVYVAELRKYKDEEVVKKTQQVELEILDEFVRICKNNNLKYYLTGGTLLGAVRHMGFIPWDDDIDVIMPVQDFDKFVNLPAKEFGEDFFLHWITTDINCVDIAAHLRKKNTFKLGWPQGYETANEKNNAVGICIFRVLYSKDKISLSAVSRYDKFLMEIHSKLQRLTYKKLGLCMTSPRTIFSIFSLPVTLKIRETVVRMFPKPKSGYWWGKKGNDVFGEGVPLEFESKIYNAPSDWDYYLLQTYGENYMQLPPLEKRFSHCPRKLSFDVKNDVWEDL